MTGLEALAEAARQEAARVYGTPQREHRSVARPQRKDPARTLRVERPRLVELDPQIIALAAAGQSAASIAFRLGTTKRRVAEVLTRRESA